jgi:hypothetical protein
MAHRTWAAPGGSGGVSGEETPRLPALDCGSPGLSHRGFDAEPRFSAWGEPLPKPPGELLARGS